MTDPSDFPYLCPKCRDPPKRFLTVVGLWSHLENKHPYHNVSNGILAGGDIPGPSGRGLDGPSNGLTGNGLDDRHGNSPSHIHYRVSGHGRYGDQDYSDDRHVSPYPWRNSGEHVNGTLQLELPPKHTKNPLNNNSRSNLSIYLPHEPQNGIQKYADYYDEHFEIRDGKSYGELMHVCEQLKQDLRVKEVRLERMNEELEKLALDRRKLQRELLDSSKDPLTDEDRMKVLRQLMDEKDQKIRETESDVIKLTDYVGLASHKERVARTELENFVNGLIRRAERAENELKSIKTPPYGAHNQNAHLLQQVGHPSIHHSYHDDMHDVNLDMFDGNAPYRHGSRGSLHDREDVLHHHHLDQQHHTLPHRPITGHTFSPTDSGMGDSVPSSAKTVERHPPHTYANVRIASGRSNPWSQNGPSESLNKHELQQKLLDVERDRLSAVQNEPPVDYDSESMTSVTDDTDPMVILDPVRMRRRRSVRRHSNARTTPPKMNTLRPSGPAPVINVRQRSYKPSDSSANLRQVALHNAFKYLSTNDLLNVARVNREWRDASRHPDLWTTIRLGKVRMDSKFLTTISRWCTKVESIILMGLKPRVRRANESTQEYIDHVEGALERGLEAILRSSGDTIKTLKIVDCRNLFTERVLWLASCHCRRLQQLVYISETDPAGAEVLWSLSAGCKDIKALVVCPIYPNAKPDKFDDRCCDMISTCWPKLSVLCIGGVKITERGLISIAEGCVNLQVLELDHMQFITKTMSSAICRRGLKKLAVLDFTFTPVAPEALLAFQSACPEMRSVSVHIGISDYFTDKRDANNVKEYQKIVKELGALLKRGAPLYRILTLQTDYG